MSWCLLSTKLFVIGVSPPILGMGGNVIKPQESSGAALRLVREEIRRAPVEVGSLSHFIHPGWCRISSINSILGKDERSSCLKVFYESLLFLPLGEEIAWKEHDPQAVVTISWDHCRSNVHQ